MGGWLEGRWCWSDFGISVALTENPVLYAMFYGNAFIPFRPPNKFDDNIGLVWKSEVPYKIKAFVWRLLLDRLLTKDLLVYRENRNHYFIGCWVVKNIWSEIAHWVKERKVDVVYLATTRTLWLVRNGVCFREERWNFNDTVWNLKLLVWKWSFCGKITRLNYSFYEFSRMPLLYLS
ncbi:uncharacterized protein LOC131598181 [Vicia villosa]|uniref:uncharacterized protein LOC131598181 n=1 Tax=Vicia villosa TaxID=3911 RepID=UPI00273AD7E5|nr:uncharacterized protein LOC131598181 [Vicia villosa]